MHSSSFSGKFYVNELWGNPFSWAQKSYTLAVSSDAAVLRETKRLANEGKSGNALLLESYRFMGMANDGLV